ncbi:MAG: AAA family ATPase [Deltaproteobacteria bacterium]|nr:AAA family ATPase [Deltaproteobacteria bacterium]
MPSRPRRFGKTLLLDTVSELFLGHRHLFENLWIGRETGYYFRPHPVIRLSVNYAVADSQNN